VIVLCGCDRSPDVAWVARRSTPRGWCWVVGTVCPGLSAGGGAAGQSAQGGQGVESQLGIVNLLGLPGVYGHG
jgi:hypothetical protein